ncbi:MAG: vitamin K epoxide reductase family protein [Nanoarchaeota archaeon]
MILKYPLVTFLFILILFVSILMSIQGIPNVCNPESCDYVKTSVYAKTFGVFNAYYGVVISALMILLLLHHIYQPTKIKKIMIYTACTIGALIAIRFLYIQAFIIKAYCTYCIIVDISLIIIIIILIGIKDNE